VTGLRGQRFARGWSAPHRSGGVQPGARERIAIGRQG
jgi:hypothetical protein